MAEPLKNMYSLDFVKSFGEVCQKHIPNFRNDVFLKSVFDENWAYLELKPRIKHIAHSLHAQLSSSIPENLKLIVAISEAIRVNQNKQDTFEFLILPDYIEIYGLDHLKDSFNAIEKVTVLATCEYAIRPFLIKYPNEVFLKLFEWTQHKHPSVRRLASEGCRPRLPWGMGVPILKKEPIAIYPILEKLLDDESLFVRRSVANNLNDISKDHPKCILILLKRWNHFSEKRNWLIKHAARTLLKQGNPEALSLFGYGNCDNFKVDGFEIGNSTVSIGEYLHFSFRIKNTTEQKQKVRLEYFIYFLLSNQTLSKKIFKISERELEANETLIYERKQSFKIISTRKYYKGIHKVSLVVNGNELESKEFTLQ